MSNSENDKPYIWGEIEFTLSNTLPEEDECKKLIFRVLRQAILDYSNYETDSTIISEEDFLTAKDMLYDEEYLVLWGDIEVTTQELCSIIDIDTEWLLNRLERKINDKRKSQSVSSGINGI